MEGDQKNLRFTEICPRTMAGVMGCWRGLNKSVHGPRTCTSWGAQSAVYKKVGTVTVTSCGVALSRGALAGQSGAKSQKIAQQSTTRAKQ